MTTTKEYTLRRQHDGSQLHQRAPHGFKELTSSSSFVRTHRRQRKMTWNRTSSLFCQLAVALSMIAVAAAGHSERKILNLDLESEFFYAVESSHQTFGDTLHPETGRSLQFFGDIAGIPPTFPPFTVPPPVKLLFSPTPRPSTAPTPQPTNRPTLRPTAAPTFPPTFGPTLAPTPQPTLVATRSPTMRPTLAPVIAPTRRPTLAPVAAPTPSPVTPPTFRPTRAPVIPPSPSPTRVPTSEPTERPQTQRPTLAPIETEQIDSETLAPVATIAPSLQPNPEPSPSPTRRPINEPTPEPTPSPTLRPTRRPINEPTPAPTRRPTRRPTNEPTPRPTRRPSRAPTIALSQSPSLPLTEEPTRRPTRRPSRQPTFRPTNELTEWPTRRPTNRPTRSPTREPTRPPTRRPTDRPTDGPTRRPTSRPTRGPTFTPTTRPTTGPTLRPTPNPTNRPTLPPSLFPTVSPTTRHSASPSISPTQSPTVIASAAPSSMPSRSPSLRPSARPSSNPTDSPSEAPSSSPSLAPSVSFQPSISSEPSLAPTPDFEFTLITLEAFRVIMEFSNQGDGRRLQEDLPSSNSTEEECMALWDNYVTQSMLSEVQQVIPRYETLNVQTKNVTRDSFEELGVLAFFYDVRIDIRSAIIVHNLKRYIGGPFDSSNEQTALVERMRASTCPEYANLSAIKVILPEDDETTISGATRSPDSTVNSGVIAGSVVAIAGAAMLVAMFIFVRGKRKRDVFEEIIFDGTQQPGQYGLHANEMASEIGLQTDVDVSTLGDPIPQSANPGTGIVGDVSTAGSFSLDYDYKAYYMYQDIPSISEEVSRGGGGESLSNTLLPADDDTFEAQYGVDEPFEVLAPPGILGLILETNTDGVPTINNIKPASVLADQVQIGDRLLSVDGIDVSIMLASDVSRLIASRKEALVRKFVFARPRKGLGTFDDESQSIE